MHGEVVGRAYALPASLRTDIRVPSLGDFLDDYLDRFGHPTKFIYGLYKARENSQDVYDFIGRTSGWLPAREATWYYEFILKFPGTFAAPLRYRSYITP